MIYTSPFLEGFRIRISQITMSCLIPRKFFGGKISFKKFDATEKYNEKNTKVFGYVRLMLIILVQVLILEMVKVFQQLDMTLNQNQ